MKQLDLDFQVLKYRWAYSMYRQIDDENCTILVTNQWYSPDEVEHEFKVHKQGWHIIGHIPQTARLCDL